MGLGRPTQKGRGLCGLHGAARRDGKGDRGHGDVVCGVDDDRDVVLPERMATANDVRADGVDQLFAHQFQAALGVLDLSGKRLRGIGELVQVLRHSGSPLFNGDVR